MLFPNNICRETSQLGGYHNNHEGNLIIIQLYRA